MRVAATAMLIALALLTPLGRNDGHAHPSSQYALALGFDLFLLGGVEFILLAVQRPDPTSSPARWSWAQARSSCRNVGR